MRDVMNDGISLQEAIQQLAEQERHYLELAHDAGRKRALLEGIVGHAPLLEQPTSDGTEVVYQEKIIWDMNPRTELMGLRVDFTGSRNLKEKLVRIADATEDGILNATAVTRFLISSGQYKSTVKHMRPNVFNVFHDNPDLFERVSMGNWRLIHKWGQMDRTSGGDNAHR